MQNRTSPATVCLKPPLLIAGEKLTSFRRKYKTAKQMQETSVNAEVIHKVNPSCKLAFMGMSL